MTVCLNGTNVDVKGVTSCTGLKLSLVECVKIVTLTTLRGVDRMNKICYEEDNKNVCRDFEIYDEVTGRKMVNKLNKGKLSAYEMDEMFNPEMY